MPRALIQIITVVLLLAPTDSLYGQIGELEITGFVDASYFGHSLEGVRSSFGLDQVEVDLARTFGQVGSLRVDLEWTNDGQGGFELDVEQGFVTLDVLGGDASLTFGKFNAPIGFELLDAPDMYQYSHALVFDFGLPTNYTGAMLSAKVGSSADLSFYVSNGWDQNTDLTGGKNIGGRLGVAVGPGATIGFSGSVDVGTPEDEDEISVADVDLTITPGPRLLLGGELNRGRVTRSGVDSDWFGYLVMSHYDLTDRYGFTVRWDYFDDRDGVRLGSGVPEVRKAITVAPTMAVDDGVGVLLEVRTAWSDSPVFVGDDGVPTRSWFGIALEMTYSF